MAHYTFRTTFPGTLDAAIARVTEALGDEGFGILTDIDMKATLKKKLGLDVRPYRILGACNPPLAHQAVEAEPDIGVLLPCGVVVRQEEDGSTAIVFMDPSVVLGVTGREDLAHLGAEIRARLERVRDVVQAG
ncbi:MAG: DUF302 domain-containing protein [Planctomycetota bacterium]